MTLNPASPNCNDRILAGLRIAVGLLFLIFAEYKVFGRQFTLGGGFQWWIHRFLAGGAYPFMVPVLQGFVLRHGTALAFLVAYGELVIGVALVAGLLVRTASFFGLLFMLSLLFASDYPGPQAAFWQYFGAALDHLVLAFCFGAFLLGEADRAFSVQRYFRRSRGAAARE